MAVDAFIFYKPAVGGGSYTPKGETTDAFFKDVFAFELKDFDFSIENKSTIGSATTGAGGGKVEFKEFTIKKPTDSASPIFFRNCAAGMHYEVVTIAIRKAGAQAGTSAAIGKPYLIFHFGTVFTTKIGWSGPGDEGPTESIVFTFGQLKIMYQAQKADGTMDNAKIAMWNQMTNTNTFTGTPQMLG